MMATTARHLALLMVLAPSLATAAAPVMSHSGRLLDSFGGGVLGSETVTFRLVDGLDVERWAETHTVMFSNGYYAVQLGTQTPLNTVDLTDDLTVVIEVNGQQLGRQVLSAAPYALGVDGAVRVSAAPSACDSTQRGSLRWQSNSLEVCSETGWVALADAGQASQGVVGFEYAQTSAALAMSGTIPWDDTIPQITEGGQIVQVSITPSSTSNLLVFEGIVHWAEPSNSSNYLTVGIFRTGQGNALVTAADAASNGNGRCTANITYPQICSLPIRFTLPVTDTNAQTYELRIGLDAGTVYVNRGFNGRKLGGTLTSGLTITEIAP